MLETTIAGSLPKPAWLAEPEKLWPAWRQDGAELERAKRDAALVWLKEQEAAGIDIVSDGEQFRVHFVHGFLEQIEGIDWARKTKMGIRDNRYVVDVLTVTSPVRRRGPVHGEQVRFTRAHTQRQLKFTLPGPMTICDTIADAHYGRRADMAMAFADILNEEARELEAAGVDVIQIRRAGLQRLHAGRQGLGHRCPAPRNRGPALPDRSAHLLRLRHRGQYPLEGDARRGMASVRGNLPGAQREPHRAGIAGVRQLAGADVATRPAQGQSNSARRDRGRHA
jgi:hypothetical protein